MMSSVYQVVEMCVVEITDFVWLVLCLLLSNASHMVTCITLPTFTPGPTKHCHTVPEQLPMNVRL